MRVSASAPFSSGVMLSALSDACSASSAFSAASDANCFASAAAFCASFFASASSLAASRSFAVSVLVFSCRIAISWLRTICASFSFSSASASKRAAAAALLEESAMCLRAVSFKSCALASSVLAFTSMVGRLAAAFCSAASTDLIRSASSEAFSFKVPALSSSSMIFSLSSSARLRSLSAVASSCPAWSLRFLTFCSAALTAFCER
mmetsp:Transcript_64503/g.151955  ORF Transcript_64503/g.151955 Transcript_64503/m.151955 type:complete len:206 (-) Transcript_64503:389-1006(-)